MMDLARENERVVHGLGRMSEAGIGTAPTIYDGDHFMVQGLIEGPTKEFVRTVLPWDEMPHALSSFDEYVGRMRAAGLLPDFDGNFSGNILYERKNRRWMAVDF